MKTNYIFKQLSLILIGFFLLATSCSDNDSSNEGEKVPFDKEKPNFTEKVAMSVHGFVVDETNQPLQNVKITAGTTTINTNEYGFFEISEANLVKDHSFVLAEKEGYFNATRTWMGAKDGSYEVRIKMLPKTVAGSFDNQNGGTVVSSQGVKLTFPASGVTKADGSSYSGNVYVAMQWLDAVSDDFGQTMPGDLSAIDSEGKTVALASYGMAGVELRGEGNELLQVASDKKVKIVAPIASELLASASPTIPLWSFDESKGMWVEEGVATKDGSNYVGELGHFSWWNFDVPYSPIVVTGAVADINNQYIGYQRFKVVYDNTSCYFTTNSKGQFSFRMFKNSAISIYTADCTAQLLKNVTFGDVDTDLGVMTVAVPYTSIKGNVTLSADNSVVISGSAILKIGNTLYYNKIQDNKFNFFYTTCTDGVETVSITANAEFVYDGGNKTSTINENVSINNATSNNVSLIVNDYAAAVNYFRYEIGGEKFELNPSTVAATDFLNIVTVQGGQYPDETLQGFYLATYNGYINLEWRPEDGTIEIGSFPISGSTVFIRNYDGAVPSISRFSISGTVTILELESDPEFYSPIKVKGTFEGTINLPSRISVGGGESIKGEFKYIGFNDYPS